MGTGRTRRHCAGPDRLLRQAMSSGHPGPARRRQCAAKPRKPRRQSDNSPPGGPRDGPGPELACTKGELGYWTLLPARGTIYPMDRKGETRVPRRKLRDIRELAVSAMNKGMHPDKVADLYDVGRSTVYNWRKEYLDKGTAAFTVKTAPGRTPRLTGAQLERLRKLVVGRDPRQLQFDFALWTRQMVRELIKREFGVDYTPKAVGNILHGMGLSPQRPLVRAYEQNPELVSMWKSKEYPAIRDAAKAAGGTVLFGDEPSIRADYHSGTTWA